MRAFQEAPSIIFPLGNDIDFFPGILSYVASPEIAGLSIKRKAPGIAKTPGKNLWPAG